MICKTHIKRRNLRVFQMFNERIRVSDKLVDRKYRKRITDEDEGEDDIDDDDEQREEESEEESEEDEDIPPTKTSKIFDTMFNRLSSAVDKGSLIWTKFDKIYTYHEQDDKEREWN